MQACRPNQMRGMTAFAIFMTATISSAPAQAEWSATLPALTACSPATKPEMPSRWRAVGLMMPFLQGQIDVGEFVYDASIPAMRASVYGLESGAVDLLITNDQTYRLSGPHASPTACAGVGRLFRPPARWLSSPAVCVGEAKLAMHMMQWWKEPGAGTNANWHWLHPGSRLPWRSMFVTRSADHAVVGDYSMTYFPTFTPSPETGLADLHKFCTKQARPKSTEATAVVAARVLMSPLNPDAETERQQRLATLIPGFSHHSCANMTNVHWPEQFVMTAIISPISFANEPNPSLIYYDWKNTKTQLAMMFGGRPSTLKGIVSLKSEVGYRMTMHKSGGASCEAVFPGIVRPNWMSAATCSCKGVIDQHDMLSPNRVTQILSCPIKSQGDRIMWNWYTTEGRPVVFAEAGAQGGGVMLADYHDWVPGQTAAQKDFDLPKICLPSGNAVHATFSDVSCSECHTTASPASLGRQHLLPFMGR
jgi:hypothetical protein